MDLSRLDTLRHATAVTTPPEMWFKEGPPPTEDLNVSVGSHPRMGIGLPLSNIFAT